MGFFDRYRQKRAIATILSASGRTPTALEAAASFRGSGKPALRLLLDALPEDRSGLICELLGDAVTNATLPQVVETGLQSGDQQMVVATRRALASARNIDPNRLLEVVMAKDGALNDIADVLVGRKDAITAKSMLLLLERARATTDPALLKLIDAIAEPAMVPALIGFLKNANWQARMQVAATISRFPSEPVREALLRLLGDPDKNVRQAALDGIAVLGMPVPIGAVCALLRDPDMLVQTKAIETAVRLNDPSSVKHLLEIMQDESEHARRAAVEVMNAVGDATAIKDLLTALKDEDWWVRVRAADALGTIGGPKVIDAVLELLGDADEFMRRTAVEILNTTKDERAFHHLVKALHDIDWWVCERAIDALANMGDRRAVPHMIQLLDPDSQATPVVIRALAQLGDPGAVTALLAKLKSTDQAIQRETIEALKALATPDQVDAIRRALAELTPAAADIGDIAQRVAQELAPKLRPHAGRPATPARPADELAHTIVSTPAAAGLDVTIRMTAHPAEHEPGAAEEGPSQPDRTIDLPAASRTAASEKIDIAAIQPGQVLGGRYRVVRELGRGGFGTVLQVEDQVVGEQVAIKLLNPQMVEDESAISRFVHEVRYARRITHENVIRIHDFQQLDNVCAISMEYFPSAPLTRQIRLGLYQQPALGLHFVRCIASGVEIAHLSGIMHRDLKPANILVDEKSALKIVDFGLAAAGSSSDSRVTKTGQLVGSPTYMSPEQARGIDIDVRTDIYSLGVIMFETFTGSVPYAGDSPLSVLYQHIEGLKQPPSARYPAIDPRIESIILKAMATDPASRYQSARELLGDLEAVDLRKAA